MRIFGGFILILVVHRATEHVEIIDESSIPVYDERYRRNKVKKCNILNCHG
jgi:hypothetical protein